VCLLRMLSEVVHPSYLCVVTRCSYGGARGHPGTCQLMGVCNCDVTLSSGHVSGSLCNRLKIGVLGLQFVGYQICNNPHSGCLSL
jgi:hypothetical protein